MYLFAMRYIFTRNIAIILGEFGLVIPEPIPKIAMVCNELRWSGSLFRIFSDRPVIY